MRDDQEKRDVNALPTFGAVVQTAGPSPVGDLFERHHARLLRIAYRITGNTGDAEDALQTVFLRILQREDGPIDGASESSYLHRAAVNAALDLLRRRKAARATAFDDAAGMAFDGPAPDQQFDLSRRADRLREALAELSPRAAAMFALRYFEGYGNREIARLLGTSWSTVAVTLHRTRARLQKSVEGDRR